MVTWSGRCWPTGLATIQARRKRGIGDPGQRGKTERPRRLLPGVWGAPRPGTQHGGARLWPEADGAVGP